MDRGREGVGREGGLTSAPSDARRPLARASAPLSAAFLPLALFTAWLAATAGLRPLLLPDEGRYASVAREMLLAGDALVPTLNGLPFFHKPPLFYWLDIAAMRVFGVGEFAARFGSLVGAWLMGAALYLFLRRRHPERTARLALVVLATSPFGFVAAQYANHDMLVAGLITAAIVAFVRAVDAPAQRAALGWLACAWAACGFALLAKGLIGVVLPALVVGPWLLAQRRWSEIPRLLHPAGLLVFALVALPWLWAMQARFPGFFDYFIVEQHFRRYAQSTFNNVHPIWFFVLVFPLLTLPWSSWLAARAAPLARGGAGPIGLWVWWIVAIVGFFSLPSSKLVGYVLPALAPVCALAALALEAVPPSQRALRATTALGALIGVGLVVALAVRSPHSHRATARALAAQVAPGDSVVMVDEYFYDLAFYAGLRAPVLVASDWADPDVPRRDNWRKELFDAARFAPEAGRRALVPIARLASLGCGTGAVWFVTKAGEGRRLAGVPGAASVHVDREAELWRAPARACAG